MYIKSHIQIPYQLWDHNIQRWRISFFPLVVERVTSFLRAKKTILGEKFDMRLFTFLFLGELGTCLCNFYPHTTYKTYRNAWLSTWRYAEICTHFQKLKKHVKNYWIENPNGKIMPYYHFYKYKKQNLKVKPQFLVNFWSFCDLIEFGQIVRINEHIPQFGGFWEALK